MTVALFGKELGTVIAEIEVDSKEDVVLLDDNFEVFEISGQVDAVDTIKFGE